MDLGELLSLAEEACPEEWAAFRVVISATSNDVHWKTTDNVKAVFDVKAGTLTIEEIDWL